MELISKNIKNIKNNKNSKNNKNNSINLNISKESSKSVDLQIQKNNYKENIRNIIRKFKTKIIYFREYIREKWIRIF